MGRHLCGTAVLLLCLAVYAGEEQPAPARSEILFSIETPAERLLVLSALGEVEKARETWPEVREGFLTGGIERGEFLSAALEYFLALHDRGLYEEGSELASSLRERNPREPFFSLFCLLSAEFRGRRAEQNELMGFFFEYYNSELFPLEEPDVVDLTAVARGVFRENPDSSRRAFRFLAQARGEMPDFLPAKWFAAEIALERYHWDFARRTLEELVTERPCLARAYSALAHLDFMESKYHLAEQHARKALELNPRSAEAKAVLSRLAYAEEDNDAALEHALDALGANPFELHARAVQMAVRGTDPGKPSEEALKRREVLGVRVAELYHHCAETSAVRRRFQEAVEFERQAARIDPFAWWAYYGAGVNLLRLGEERKARDVLEKSFELNPFNVWCYNLLKVLDRDYRAGDLAHITSDSFLLKIPTRERPVYGRHLSALLEEVFTSYEKRWGIEAKGPEGSPGPLIEVLPDHEDFSVRSVGLPNLGALGVCFGRVVLCPSAQELSRRFKSSYVIILRHELSHAFTLQKSGYKVPRWLTEGIAMHDEGIPNYEWDTILLYAVSENVDTSIARLNRYFGRPSGRRDVELAYAVSYFTLGWIVSEWGAEAVDKMVALYGRYGSNEHGRVVREGLGLGMEDFERKKDKAMREYVKREVPLLPPVNEASLERATRLLREDPGDKNALITLIRGLWASGNMAPVREKLPRLYRDHPDDAVVGGLYGQLLLDEGKTGEALKVLEESLKEEERFWNLFLAGIAASRIGQDRKSAGYLRRAEEAMPHNVGEANPAGKPLRRLLAEVLVRLHRPEKARAALVRQLSHTGADLESAGLLAELALKSGDEDALALALERIVNIDPFDGGFRLERAAFLRRKGFPKKAYYEYNAAVVLLDDSVEALRGLIDTGLDLARSGRLSAGEASDLLDATRLLRAKAPHDALLDRRADDIGLLKGTEDGQRK